MDNSNTVTTGIKVADLLASLRSAGHAFRVDGDRLIGPPADSLSTEHRAAVKANRDVLIGLLRAEASAWDEPAAWKLLESTDAELERQRRGLRGDPRAVAIADLCADAFCRHDLPEMRRLCALALGLETGVTDAPPTWPEELGKFSAQPPPKWEP